MFQFPGFAPCLRRVPCLQHGGLPHSDITGSKVICTSPELFAAYHVLLRLQEPRHPPYALTILSFVFFYVISLFQHVKELYPVKKRNQVVTKQPNVCMLSQLCYCMKRTLKKFETLKCEHLQTHLLTGRISNGIVENKGVEPLTLSLQS